MTSQSISGSSAAPVAQGMVFSATNAAAYVCKRTQNVMLAASALHAMAKFGVKHGVEAVCGGATLTAGLGMLFNGNFFSGAGLTIAGAKQIYNILKPVETDVKELLQNARSGLDMITILEKANQDSFANVDANLVIVADNVKKLEESLNSIRQLADHGSKKVRTQKEKANALYAEAMTLFQQTQGVFVRAQSQVSGANTQFATALSRIEELIELAQTTGGDQMAKIEEFSRLSKEIHSECSNAKEKLEGGNKALTDGIMLLNDAMAKFIAASTESGKAIQMSLNKLDKIKERAERSKLEADSQNRVQAIRQELADTQARSNDILNIADQANRDLAEAERLNEVQFGLQSIIIGGGFGAFLGAAFVGPTGAAVGATAGTAAYHNRETIGNFVFGKDPAPVPVIPTTSEPVTYAFNTHSTGFWGRYIQKKGSQTAGKAAIDVGNNEKLELNFNLNSKKIVARKELKKVYDVLSGKLTDGKITAQECLNVITKMETLTIDRGSRGKVIGLIKTDDAYFAELKRRCHRQIG